MWTPLSLSDAEVTLVQRRATLFLATSIEHVASVLSSTPIADHDGLDSFRAVAARSADAAWIFLQRVHSPVSGVEVVTSAGVDPSKAADSVCELLQLELQCVVWRAT